MICEKVQFVLGISRNGYFVADAFPGLSISSATFDAVDEASRVIGGGKRRAKEFCEVDLRNMQGYGVVTSLVGVLWHHS